MPKNRGFQDIKKIDIFLRIGYNISLTEFNFTYGGYDMGKKKDEWDNEEMRADLENRIDEDFFDDEFYREEEDDLYDEDNFDPSYYQAVFNVPVINIRKGVTDQNFGYAQGVTYNGVPFVAEVYDWADSEFLVVYIPAFIHFPEKYDTDKKIKKELKRTTDKIDVLDIGMFDAGEETDKNEIIRHINFLSANELVIFTSEKFKATVSYRIDKNGTKLAKITVTLVDNDAFYGMTDLDMKLFNDGGEGVKPSARMFKMEDYR